MTRRLSLLVLALFAVPAVYAAPPVEKIRPDDGKLLKAAKIDAEAPVLLDYFRKRTITAKEREQIAGLIRLLGDDSFKVREKANDELLALGASVLPQLRQAVANPDEEVRERARETIAALEAKANPELTAAVVRVLRVRAPADTVKTLLAFLPDAENEAVADEVLMTLAILGVKENKIDPLLVDALKDKQPARRAAAALVLGRSGTADQRRQVQALLKDDSARVRFRAAQGLLAARDRTAIPALIALLSEPVPEWANRAEELLSCIAGARNPHMPLADNVLQNRAVRNAWERWWKQNAKIDLSRTDVDLPLFNATLRARETARQFAAAVAANNSDKLDKLLELPFYTLEQGPLAKREPAGQYLANLTQTVVQRGCPLNPLVQGSMSMDEYLKTAQPQEKQQLAKMRRTDVRVVVVSWAGNFPQRPPGFGESVLFIRVAGDQPQVAGIGFKGDNRVLER